MNSILSDFIIDVYSEGTQRRQGDWKKNRYNVLGFFSCARLAVKAFEGTLHLGFLIIRNIVQAGAEVWVQLHCGERSQCWINDLQEGALSCKAAWHSRPSGFLLESRRMEGKMSRRDSDKQMSPLGFIFLSPAGPNDLCVFGSVSFSPSHTPSLPLFLAMAIIVLISL